eukprot:Unigene10094_Nuclearia_a/m.30810 Unigene10094_Nuclearia_a/g.30810  ORF Unigene10094_Nuclearia_a/g.30810 Unigene10094_Nuclearia_a/m.30810 type:complete len:1081 (+) Unigene10094_Nuclearia_a:45-3287(+)
MSATTAAPTAAPTAAATAAPTDISPEDALDIVAVALVMILPFLIIPSLVILFRATKRFLRWFNSKSKKMERYIDAELSWVAKINDRIRHVFEMSLLGRYWNMLQAYFTVASLIFYIVGTYTRRIAYAGQVLQALQMFCAFFFMVDYMLLMLVAQDRLRFFFTIYSIIDLLSIMPAFTLFFLPPSLIGVNLFEVILVLPALRILRFDRILYFTKSEVQREVGLLALPFLSLMFLSTSVINAIQSFYDANSIPANPADISLFHDALYFIIVTMSTVGYGDVSPQHTAIRVIMMCLIIVFLIMLPIYTGRLVEVLSKRATIYERAYEPTTPHFVVLGNVNYENTLVFVREMLNNANDGGRTKILLMSTSPSPSAELKSFIEQAYFRHKITYLQGSPLVQVDLQRTRLAQAKAVFIVAASAADDNATMTDATVALYASTIKRYTPETPVFIQLHTAETADTSMMQQCDRILCIEDLKMALLGRTCLVPGTLAFITNIFSSYRQPVDTAPSRWQEEYAYGSCHGIVPFVMPSAFAGEPFWSAALAIFADHGAILVAVKRGNKPLLLAPCAETGYTVRAGDVGLLLCHDGDAIPADYYDTDEPTSQDGAGFLDENSNGADTVPLKDFFSASEPTNIQRKLARKGSRTSMLSHSGSEGASAATAAATPTLTDPFELGDTFDAGSQPHEADAGGADPSSEPVLLEDILAQPLQEGEFEQHVIVCGLSLSLASLIRPLRSSRLRRKQPVVIVSELEPDPDLWNEIEALEHVYLVLGAPRKPSVLKRAGIATCSTVIILLDKTGSRSEYDETADAEVVYISKLASELNRSANIITELMHYFHLLAPEEDGLEDRIARMRIDLNRPDLPFRVRYTHMLQWKRERGVRFDAGRGDDESARDKEQIIEYRPDGTRYVREIDRSQSNRDAYDSATSELTATGMVRSFPSYHFNPFFASGNLYCPSAADALLFTEYYRPFIIETVNQLLSMTEQAGSAHLFIKPVPEKFVNTSYIELASYLLRHEIVPVALYRPAELHGNPQPYVYTNPTRLTRLAHGDRVLVLAAHEPGSLDDKSLVQFRARSLMATRSAPVYS